MSQKLIRILIEIATTIALVTSTNEGDRDRYFPITRLEAGMRRARNERNDARAMTYNN